MENNNNVTNMAPKLSFRVALAKEENADVGDRSTDNSDSQYDSLNEIETGL